MMIEPTPKEAMELASFVREGLGCGCPDEVFSDLQIEPHPEAFIGLPIDSLVRIGGRLMVAVCASPEWREVSGDLKQVLEAGMSLRDHDGFNMFRLVVAPDEARITKQLFKFTPGLDDRVHLHVVSHSALPSCLKCP
nr:putative uncharacterized protein [uncultured bacterium]